MTTKKHPTPATIQRAINRAEDAIFSLAGAADRAWKRANDAKMSSLDGLPSLRRLQQAVTILRDVEAELVLARAAIARAVALSKKGARP